MRNISTGMRADRSFPFSLAEAIPDSSVRTAMAADARRCFEVLVLAFESDPVCRWVWPERRQYLKAFPRFARAFGGGAIDLGSAHYYEGFLGVALWLPPGVGPDEESLVEIMQETVAEKRREAVFSMFEQMGAYHPGEPHMHLPLIGVGPASQGRGVGSELLRAMLDASDRDQVPAYLEATSARNAALYQRHGFEALGRIGVADCPVIVPMLRRPR
jgi:ribosomal protein S18 acetylase RimI-like enzyme